MNEKPVTREVPGNVIKKKRGRGRREIILLSALAVLVILILFLFSASSSRADETGAQTQPEKTAPQKSTGVPWQGHDKSATPVAKEQPSPSTPPVQPATPATGASAPAAEASQPPAAQQKIDDLRKRVAADSLNARLHFELANALHDADKRDEALAEYDRAIAINPQYVEAMVNKGAVLNEMGSIAAAIATFQRALALKPNDTRALCNLGNSYYALKDYGNAIKNYELSIKADSTFAEGYYYMGIAFADAGIYREAVREWENILRVAPNSEAARTATENINALKSFMTSQ